jgi:subtilisin family serine protease
VDTPIFQTQVSPDGAFVFPSDAMAAVRSGQLDRKLFDVKYLVENGYTDEQSQQLPVIVEYQRQLPDATQRQRADALPASTVKHALKSIDGASLSVSKKDAEAFWDSLRGHQGRAGGKPAGASLASGVTKVWLDRKVMVTLNESVPLIGAPQAWAAGFDGTGVEVAVLDTGIDNTHPDLAGKVVASKSFVSDTVKDGHGHGTHVASTIVGTGAASGGSRKGVAPGAKLIVGKVLNDGGEGTEEQIIAGMEWATIEQHADVVSMSLGGGPTDGTDPLSQSVNQLTASTGALFVIAAGNAGRYGTETINTPGAADSALTVAATTKTDQLAAFSSRGPRFSDLALKPDIAAPGVDIAAARAAGTTMGTPVDTYYTRASGTSMATPHVAGAAAIVAQIHPDWRAPQLKAALMSTAHDVGTTVYETGAGRVDVTRAASQKLFATTANLDFGAVNPGEQPAPISKQITYSNLSTAPVTLTLMPSLRTAAGVPAPDGALTADKTVTVPAGGTATATVTADIAGLGLDRYTGAVVATDEAGGVRLTTPVGLVREVPKTPLIVRVLDRNGEPNEAFLWVTALDVPDVTDVLVTEIAPGLFRAWVAPGTYSVHALTTWMDPITARINYGFLTNPQVSVTGPTDVTLDARQAQPVTFSTPRPSVPYAVSVAYVRTRSDGSQGIELMTSGSYEFSEDPIWVSPTQRTSVGGFWFGTRWTLGPPQATMTVQQPERMDLHLLHRGYGDRGQVFGRPDNGWVPFTGDHKLELVNAGFGAPKDLAGLNLKGKLALLQWGDDRFGYTTEDPPDGVADSYLWVDRVDDLRKAGAVGFLAMSNPPAEWARHMGFSTPSPFVAAVPGGPQEITLPEAQIPRDEGKRLLEMLGKGPVTIDVHGDPNIPYTYQLNPFEEQQISGSQSRAFDNQDLAVVDTDYHATSATIADTFFTAFAPTETFAAISEFRLAAPQTHTQYVGPLDPRVVVWENTWIGDVDTTNAYHSYHAFRVYDRPTRTAEHWGAVPATPGMLSFQSPPGSEAAWRFCGMCREGDIFWPFHFDTFGKGDISYEYENAGNGLRLYRSNGQEIPPTAGEEIIGVPGFQLPKESDTYRLVRTGSRVSTAWTFGSAAPDRDAMSPGSPCVGRLVIGWTQPCRAERLVFVGYDLGDSLALDNTVAASRDHQFRVDVYHQQSPAAMPAIAGVKLWASTDDGAHWKQVLLTRDQDGSYLATTRYPDYADTTGAVSLKAEAWDADGNRVEQTVMRAFNLRQIQTVSPARIPLD